MKTWKLLIAYICLPFCVNYFSIHAVYGQGTEDAAATTFSNVRRADFRKLLGVESSFEGLTLKYDKDKTIIEGTGGVALNPRGTQFLNIGGSIGTTTNLLTFFNQDLLPTFSILGSYNVLFGPSRWFYDNSFSANFASLQSPATALSGIVAGGPFNYRQTLRDEVITGKLTSATRIYSHKRLYWLSGTAKYNNSKYGFFDAGRAFDRQLFDTTYQTLSARVSLNGYWFWNKTYFDWNGFRPDFIFLSLYGQVNKSNNVAQMKKVTVNDVSQTIIDSGSKTIRDVIGTSQNYYSGQYREYTNLALGAQLYISPIRFVTLTFFGEYNFLPEYDRNTYNLNNYGNFGTGLYVYTGSDNKSQVNIGVIYRRLQSSSDEEWTNRLELATSVPIGPM